MSRPSPGSSPTGRARRPAPTGGSRRDSLDVPVLSGPHGGPRLLVLMVIPEEMEDTMRHEESELPLYVRVVPGRFSRAHDHVAEQSLLIHGEREDVCGSFFAHVGDVEVGHLLRGDERQRELAVRPAFRLERSL